MANTVFFPVIDLVSTGRSIERCRKEAGLSVRDVQEYFGFEYPQAVYKWQHGECLPSVDNLLALARLLKVNMEDLLVVDDREVSIFLDACIWGEFLKNKTASVAGGNLCDRKLFTYRIFFQTAMFRYRRLPESAFPVSGISLIAACDEITACDTANVMKPVVESVDFKKEASAHESG